MKVRSWAVLGVVVGVSIVSSLVVGCGPSVPPPEPTKQSGPTADINPDVGALLYKPLLPDPKPVALQNRVTELVIPNCTVQYEDRQTLSAEVDGRVDLIAVRFDPVRDPATGAYVVPPTFHPHVLPDGTVETFAATYERVDMRDPAAAPDGTALPPELVAPTDTVASVRFVCTSYIFTVKRPDGSIDLTETFRRDIVPNTKAVQETYTLRRAGGSEVTSNYKPNTTLVFHPRDRDEKMPLWLVKEGAVVCAGQAVCYLDDQMMSNKMKSARLTKAAALEVETSAREGVRLTNEKLMLTKNAATKGGAGYGEYLQDQITLTRFQENLAQARQTIAKADAEFEDARQMIQKHRISSTVTGIVRGLAKHPGEFVKSGEKIMEIQSNEQVRLEGNLDIQYGSLVKRDMRVTVEPALPNAPLKSHAWHRREVTGIAVSANASRPLVVSAGADGSALVWDVTRPDATAHTLPHLVPVRSVACSPVAAKNNVVITGSDDGKVRIWDLSNPDKLPSAPKLELKDTHAAAVSSVAFSPDGKFFATAAGREVFIWDIETTGEKRYALSADHRDNITSISFTPQCTLVTASKDRTLKVWKLGDKQAAVAKTLDHRAGAVDVLGVSRDGGRVLFDQDKSRIDLVNLADKQTVGQIQNLGPTAAFATVALFNNDDTMLVTAGGDGELKGGLQMWTVPPAGGRGAEIARQITPGRVNVTCAAFSPLKDVPFLVVGTTEGSVHMWPLPSADARKTYTGKVVNVDSTDPRYVTVRVEMSNKELGLYDRSAATVIITPGQ